MLREKQSLFKLNICKYLSKKKILYFKKKARLRYSSGSQSFHIMTAYYHRNQFCGPTLI